MAAYNSDMKTGKQQIITSWTWDAEDVNTENLDTSVMPNVLALPGAGPLNIANFEDVCALLPTRLMIITDEGKSVALDIERWSCDNYPVKGAYEGVYTFAAVLPERYILDESVNSPIIEV